MKAVLTGKMWKNKVQNEIYFLKHSLKVWRDKFDNDGLFKSAKRNKLFK